jgi:hypothetical protein
MSPLIPTLCSWCDSGGIAIVQWYDSGLAIASQKFSCGDVLVCDFGDVRQVLKIILLHRDINIIMALQNNDSPGVTKCYAHDKTHLACSVSRSDVVCFHRLRYLQWCYRFVA